MFIGNRLVRVSGESNVGTANSVFEWFTKPERPQIQEKARKPVILKVVRRAAAAPRQRTLVRLSVGCSAALVGIVLLGYLILRTGPDVVWKQLQAVGWGVALIITLGGVSQLVKTCSWRQAFTCDLSRLSWFRSIVAQLISDGIGQFGVAGKVLGEGMRISLLGRSVPLSSALSAGAIDAALHSFTAVLITVSGIAATLLLAPLSGTLQFYALLLVAALITVVILAGVAVTKRWHPIGNTIRAIARLPRIGNWIRGMQPVIDSAEDKLLSFHDAAPAAFRAAFLFNLLWHVLAVLEVYVILRFMGTKIAVGGAFIVESLTKVINLVGALNPGNFGTYEAGNMIIAKIFGVTSTAGLTLALCRRVRIVFWAGFGAMCMIAMKRIDSAQPNNSEHGSASGVVLQRTDAGFVTG
jgi:uncharacterized membrane protein YuzA (DUF378 family)